MFRFGGFKARFGTWRDDALNGTDGRDLIFGFGGNDTIEAFGGNDTVFAGRGDDFVAGGPGADRLFGGAGRDVLIGADGNDTLKGGRGDDRLFGDAGNDRLCGGRGNDTLDGGFGDDRFTGGRGADTFVLQDLSGHDRITDFRLSQGDRLDVTGVTNGSGGPVTTADVTVTVNANHTRTVHFPSGASVTLPRGTLDLSSPEAQQASLAAIGIPDAPVVETVIYEPILLDQLGPIEMDVTRGAEIALLTPTEDRSRYDPAVLQELAGALDQGWQFYEEITGMTPEVNPRFAVDGLATVAVVPSSCGLGCAFLGSTGLELWQTPGFDETVHDAYRDLGALPQYPFYEISRNFWFYDSQLLALSPAIATTGYAVVNRYIAMEDKGIPQVELYQRDASGNLYGAEEFQTLWLDDSYADYFSNSAFNWLDTVLPNAPIGTYGNVPETGDHIIAGFTMRVYEDFGKADYVDFWHNIGAAGETDDPLVSTQILIDAATDATGVDHSFVLKSGGESYVVGTSASETLSLGDGPDKVAFGFRGDDTIVGGTGDDLIFGGRGADQLIGANGNDTLVGGIGADELLGDAGNDHLIGAAGDDTLDGGFGDDHFEGGSGADTFVFNITQNQGVETLSDFAGAEDRLGFLGLTDQGAPGLTDDLDAITTVVDAGLGADVTVTFTSGTQLVFTGLGTGGIGSLADLVDDPFGQLLGADMLL